MPRVLGLLRQEPMELEGLVALVAAGIGAVPTCAVWAVVVAVRLAAGRSVAAACWVVEWVPGVHQTVLHRRRRSRRQRA